MARTDDKSFHSKPDPYPGPAVKSDSTSIDDRDPVDRLAEEFVERLRRGEHPSVSDYAAAHPEHAEQIRELLPAVAQMEYLKRFRRATGLGDAAPLPDQFGDFQIVRELGRGGMGVVFEAVQESLGRPVALKVLASHSQNDGIRRERFIREAHAAARLHHSNIVPVFGVGEQDGIPYYVMQVIRGQGLNTVAQRWRKEEGQAEQSAVSTFPTHPIRKNAPAAPRAAEIIPNPPKYRNWRFVAEVGLQTADALHYAHKQGVLHRDVKPGNLILDSTKRVWITDFGLAKLIDLNGITASGDILGTLQYLAPECLAGDSDPRSDVYGLGATLYELLTLTPPYSPDTPARLLKQVADTDPTPPRQLNPDIPLELETIVLKAMAREPDHRYVSARDLAQDLQAFLDDRPIKARRQSWHSRMRRWTRRNKAVTVLSATVVAALFLAGTVGWVGFARTEKALTNEESRRKEAERAREEAEAAKRDAVDATDKLAANLKLTLATFETVFEAASANQQGMGMLGWNPPDRPGRFGGGKGPRYGPPDGGPGGPPDGPGGPGGPGANRRPDQGATDTSARMLEAILAVYDRFAEQNATIPQLQLEAAKAHRRVAEARLWLRENDKALQSFNRAIELLKRLQAEYPENQQIEVEIARTYVSAPPEMTKIDEQTLLDSLETVRKADGDSQPFVAGSNLLKLASVKERRGDLAGAEEAYRLAVTALAPVRPADDGRPPPVVTARAWARYLLAGLELKSGRQKDAIKTLTDLVDELHDVPDQSGRGSMPQLDVESSAHEQLARIYEQLNDRPAADAERGLAEDLKRRLKDGPGRGGPGGGPPGGFGDPGGPPMPKKK